MSRTFARLAYRSGFWTPIKRVEVVVTEWVVAAFYTYQDGSMKIRALPVECGKLKPGPWDEDGLWADDHQLAIWTGIDYDCPINF